MPLYLVSYDIKDDADKQYEPLWSLLRKWSAVRILYSEWLVVADAGKAMAIATEANKAIQAGDRLLVQEVGRDAAWTNLFVSDEVFRRLLTNARF